MLDVFHPDDYADDPHPSFDQIELTHLITVIARSDVSAEAAAIVGAFGGVRTRVAGKVEHQPRIGGLRSGQAHVRSGLLAAIAGVERSRFEHELPRREMLR